MNDQEPDYGCLLIALLIVAVVLAVVLSRSLVLTERAGLRERAGAPLRYRPMTSPCVTAARGQEPA